MGPKVVMGRDGWMYFRRDGTIDTVEDRLGLIKLSPQLMKVWQERIQKRSDELSARGIKYLYVIVPNKESIYPEHLPEWLKPGAPTKTDQMVAYLRAHSTVPILDLRPILQSARQSDPLYYKTDSHWNLMGAFMAAETIITNLSGQMPDLTALSVADFDIQRVPGPGGDLARIAGSPEWLDDNRYVFTPKPYLPRLEFSSPETNHLDWARIGTLPVAPERVMTTINSQRPLKVNIYGDSFSVACNHFWRFTLGRSLWSSMDSAKCPI
jgi:alginate O-acetyltransferase complex protein AlgJ